MISASRVSRASSLALRPRPQTVGNGVIEPLELAGDGAGQIVPADSRKPSTAGPAAQKAGQQVDLALLLPEARCLDRRDTRVLIDLALPGLHPLPKLPFDDPVFGDLGDDKRFRRVQSRDTAAGGRVLHIAQPIPHQPADVEFVVEQARTADAKTADRSERRLIY